MRDYAKVSPEFWTGDTGRFLRRAGRDAQTIAMYLITGPNANMIGLYHLPLPLVAHHIGMTIEGARKALQRASEGGFCAYDEAGEIVWVPEMAKYQLGDLISVRDNRHKAIVRESASYRKSRFYLDFYAKYRVAYELPEPSPLEGASKPLRSQEQEQEKEQEQEYPPHPPETGGDRSPESTKRNRPTKPKDDYDPLAVDLPFAGDAFRAAWVQWVTYRADRKPKVTRHSGPEQLRKLAAMGEDRAIACIRNSIAGSYQGLFELDGGSNGRRTGGPGGPDRGGRVGLAPGTTVPVNDLDLPAPGARVQRTLDGT